ncbi:LutC/YkgG family protein [Spirillospora sp. CA-294931]|uniref:LutC/YkgG family protein n=1 Tax=Spirillospora sp. CA-294931 TaxID=3240042 RepID=UPI003D924C2D
MSSRDLVLARVRAALAGVTDDEVEVPRDYQVSRTGGDLVELLVDRLLDYGAVVHRGGPVAARLDGWGVVAVPPGLPAEWVEGIPTAREPLTPAALDALDGVVTGCAVAIAETGTLVLDASAGQGRRALTLVPDRHLCVVRSDQIVRTVPEALGRLDPARPLTWISGPSATSDIELDRVEGVHGPRTLEVVLLG